MPRNTPDKITVGTDGYSLPIVELLTGRGFITGKSGSGKSNSVSVVIEKLLDNNLPVLIVDTDGEYWGLKEEYEILHVGADEECDLQVGSEHAEKLADLALNQNIPIILDVSGYLDEDEGDAVIRETARHLFAKEKKLNKPFLLVLEECHEYIPEKHGLSDTGKMLVKIGKRGRKHGLGIVGISQRPADVKKDFITQCDWLVWHRLTWDNDTNVVGRVIGSEYKEPVQDLDDGEAFVMADWNDEIERVQWERKRTYDAGATPDLGTFERPELKSVNTDLVSELEDISDREEQRQDRISQLEREVEEREERIEELETDLESANDIRELAEKMASAFQGEGGGEGATQKMNELVAENNKLESAIEKRDAEIKSLKDEVAQLQREVENRPTEEEVEEAREAAERLAEAFGIGSGDSVKKWKKKYQRANERVEELENGDGELESPPEPDVMEHTAVKQYVSRMKKEIRSLGEKEQEMLKWYKFNGPGSSADAYWAAGGSRKSSARNKKNKTLKQKDLIEQVERGTYAYAVDSCVQEWFSSNDEITEEHIQHITAEIESVLTDASQS